MLPAKEPAADPRPVACHRSVAAVARPHLAMFAQVWLQAKLVSVFGLEWWAALTAMEQEFVLQLVCHLQVAPQWAALDRKARYLEQSYSEPGSLLERPMEVAKARATQPHQHPQCRRLQSQRWRAMISQQLVAAFESQGTVLAVRRFGSARLDL